MTSAVHPMSLRTTGRQTLVLLLIGTFITICIGISAYALLQTSATESRRRSDVALNRKDRTRSDAEIATIAKRVFKLERPTTAELNDAVIVALRSCSRQAMCRSAFMDAAPRGRRGPTGAKGATGARGVAGADGSRGAAGRTGKTGAKGATGPQGPAGPQGAAGLPASTAALLAELCRRAPVLRPLLCT
jgi:hypothetical protein